MDRRTPAQRGGFTLIELMVVIAIIAILAGLVVPAVMDAMRGVRQNALRLEVDALAQAVQRYHDKYGEYPPDGSDWNVFKRHLQKAFPGILASELALLDPTIGSTVPNDHRQFNFSGDISNGGPALRNSSDSAVVEGGNITVNQLKVMDPAEALVFFLGGFSSDPKRPFTGPGGPFIELVHDDEVHYGYNPARENPLYEFNAGQLTIATYTGPDGDVITASNDEGFGGAASDPYVQLAVPTNTGNDLLPVYLPQNGDRATHAPYVYFDSRTYISNKSSNASVPNPYINFYQPMRVTGTAAEDSAGFGAVYPMYSDQPNTAQKGLPGIPITTTGPNAAFLQFLMMEPQGFQIIGPGIDGRYGGRVVAEVRTAGDPARAVQETLFLFPSGRNLYTAVAKDRGRNKAFVVTPVYGQDPAKVPPDQLTRMNDNVSNFSASSFEAGMQ